MSKGRDKPRVGELRPSQMLTTFGVGSVRYEGFASGQVIANLFIDNAFLIVLAAGMTFVILSGGIDLSVGSVVALSTMVTAAGLRAGWPVPLVIIAVLVIGSTLGLLMGLVIHKFDIQPFIVTLAGMFLARGMAFVLSIDSVPVKHPFYATMKAFYYRLPGGGRITLIGGLMLLVFAAGILIAHRTRFGANVYALGGGVQTARLMGVPVARTTIAIYAFSGLLAGLSGIVFSLYTSAGYSLAAVGVELDAIAAVVIGGTLLTGGSGFVGGTLIGILIMGLIQTYITFDGSLSSWWTKILIGLLLFGFILMQKGFLYLSKGGRRLA